MARPTIYNWEEIIKTIEQYIKDTELPILKEVCYLNGWNYQYIRDNEKKNDALKYTIKKLTAKKEVELEKGGLTGKYNPTIVVFSLKQLGWKDKNEDSDREREEETIQAMKQIDIKFVDASGGGNGKKD